jgi:cell division protein FtsW (lipid II flippase)
MKRVQAGWKIFLEQDFLAILLVLGLLLTGLTFIYSASWRGEETGIVGSWFPRQIMWAALGAGVATALVAVDYRFWLRQAWWLYLAALVLLGLVLVMGTKVYGAYRWLNVFGVLVQPSEFAKVALVVLLARVLGGGALHPRSFGTIMVALVLMGLPFG